MRAGRHVIARAVHSELPERRVEASDGNDGVRRVATQRPLFRGIVPFVVELRVTDSRSPLRSHLYYARSATMPSGGASASRAPTRCCRSMHGTRVRGTSNVRPWNPVVTAIAGPPFPRHGTRTPRECPEGSAPEGDRPTVFGTVSRLGWPPERRGYALAWLLSPRKERWRDASAGKRPMNRAKTPLRRRAAPGAGGPLRDALAEAVGGPAGGAFPISRSSAVGL